MGIVSVIRRETGHGSRRGGRRPGGDAYIDSFTFKGTKIYYLNAIDEDVVEEFPVSPAWCVTEDRFLLSLYPQMLKSALLRSEEKQNSIAKHPALKDRGESFALSFVDFPEFFRTLYPVLPPLAFFICSELQSEGINIKLPALPTARGILPHLRCETCTAKRTGQGLLITSQGSLPAGGILGGGFLPTLSFPITGTMGLYAGTARREVMAARTRAEVARDSAMLRNVCHALTAYSNAHNGRYPESLEELTGNYLDGIPRDHKGRPFIYLAPERFSASGSPKPMVATASPIRGRRTVAFEDGRVRQIPEPVFLKMKAEKRKEQSEDQRKADAEALSPRRVSR